RLGPAAQELLSGLLAVAPAALALRGADVGAYEGAEHMSIGTYEHGKRAEREHERCGSHLLGPLLATTAIGNTLASHAPEQMRTAARLGAQFAAVAASTEIFGWMVRNPDKPLARALAKPGHELQHRVATAEPTPEQIEVAEAAPAACLELERGCRGPSTRARASACRRRSSTFRSTRCGRATTPTPTSTTPARRSCRTAGTRVWSCRSSRSSTRISAAWTRRSRSSSCA